MKKQSISKSRLAANSKMLLPLALLSVPLISMPSVGFAQSSLQNQKPVKIQNQSKAIGTQEQAYTVKISSNKNCVLVGLDKGRPIYKNSKGEFFSLDPKTGDQKLLSSDIYHKFSYTSVSKKGEPIQGFKFKGENKVTVVGIDNKGNVIQKNSKGEKFYINPVNGDFIYVK